MGHRRPKGSVVPISQSFVNVLQKLPFVMQLLLRSLGLVTMQWMLMFPARSAESISKRPLLVLVGPLPPTISQSSINFERSLILCTCRSLEAAVEHLRSIGQMNLALVAAAVLQLLMMTMTCTGRQGDLPILRDG